jgi:hypothetical protein
LLGLERLCEQFSHLGVGDERDSKVRGQTTDLVVGLGAAGVVVGEHQHHVDLLLLWSGIVKSRDKSEGLSDLVLITNKYIHTHINTYI